MFFNMTGKNIQLKTFAIFREHRNIDLPGRPHRSHGCNLQTRARRKRVHFPSNNCSAPIERQTTGSKERKGERLLKRLITLATRHVVLRWPLDSCPPEVSFVIDEPDRNPDMFDTTYHCDYSGDPVGLEDIIEILQRLQSSFGNTILALTVQNVKFYTNYMRVVPHGFPTVHYENVQIYCHIEPSSSGHDPKPIVFRIKIDRKTLTGNDLEPLKNLPPYDISFRYFNLFLPALSPEEERCMDRVLQSHQKIYPFINYWNGYFGRHLEWESTIPEMQLTMDEMHTHPLWQQYLARDLLQYYPLENISETSENALCGRSAIKRVLGPFKRKYTECSYTTCSFAEETTSVPPPLW
ncbi:uncharacterized protein LOC129591507 [Paramacrobiotus metropolitanus]|uniref:uncharacterized protein LOC129591507 n=1 Tax=Paramacrobiotus metropolitanus TaxID=2943436 RepID=UPI002445C8F3|nr:uncharacterized protein LOC129591507 [Paramacrobiotus metropolitanus]